MLTFHHLGCALPSIREYLHSFLVPLFGPTAIGEEIEDPLQRIRLLFVELRGGARLELIEPLDETSPLRGILARGHGSLYHCAYLVDDLDESLGRFRAAGCLPISGPTPAVAFGGRRIAFLLTSQKDMLELIEQLAEAQ